MGPPTGSQKGRRARRLALAALLAAAAGAAVHVRRSAAARDDDRAALDPVFARDADAARAMKEADDAVRRGDGPGAIDALSRRAAPAVDEGLRAAEGATLRTPWGRERRDAVAAVLRDRKAELPRYEAALRSGDAAELLATLERQADIERRALAAVAAVAGDE